MKNGQPVKITVNGKLVGETDLTKTPLIVQTVKTSKGFKKFIKKLGKPKTCTIPFDSFIDKLPND